jgi:hypothetical protein
MKIQAKLTWIKEDYLYQWSLPLDLFQDLKHAFKGQTTRCSNQSPQRKSAIQKPAAWNVEGI